MPILRIFSIVLLFDIKKPHTLRKLARFRDIQAPHELTYNYDATYDHLFFKHVEQIEWSFSRQVCATTFQPYQNVFSTNQWSGVGLQDRQKQIIYITI